MKATTSMQSLETGLTLNFFITESALALDLIDNNVLPADKDSILLVLGCPCFGLPGVAALQLGYKNTTFVSVLWFVNGLNI